MIVNQKARFETAVGEVLDDFETRAAAAEAAQDQAHADAGDWFYAEAARLTQELADAIDAAIDSFNNTLDAARQQFNDVIDAATAAHEADLATRLAWWNAQMEHELKHARWTKDSYYRYHLLRLIQAKDDDVHAALNAARAAWAAWVAGEQAESMAFRGAQRDALAASAAVDRQNLVDAIAADVEYGTGVWSELDQALDAFLMSERDRLNAAIDDWRASFKADLKKIYGFNYDEFLGYTEDDKHYGFHGHGYNVYAPYTHHQHQQFLWKFNHYHDIQLAQMDADTATLMDIVNAKTALLSDQAAQQSQDGQNAIDADRAQRQASLAALAASELESYSQTQDIELDNLQELSQALQDAAIAKCEVLRKQIIYATHVLRYAGRQQQHGGTNFNSHGRLTGIDELDTLDMTNEDYFNLAKDNVNHVGGHHGYNEFGHGGYGYAQVTFDDDLRALYEHADEFTHKYKESVDQAKSDFDAWIQKTRDDYRDAVDTELDESNERREAINDLIWNTAESHADGLWDLSTGLLDGMSDDNDARQQACNDASQALLDAFIATVDAQRDNVAKWFGDRLEWVNRLHDDAYRAHLIAELEAKRDSANADLDAREATARAKVETARNNLATNQSGSYDDLANNAFGNKLGFYDWADDLKNATADAGQTIALDFDDAAEAEDAALNAWLDELVRKWAWWLRKFYGYDGYAHHYYEGYHDDYVDDWHSYDQENASLYYDSYGLEHHDDDGSYEPDHDHDFDYDYSNFGNNGYGPLDHGYAGHPAYGAHPGGHGGFGYGHGYSHDGYHGMDHAY
jgi:hypothetical protein